MNGVVGDGKRIDVKRTLLALCERLEEMPDNEGLKVLRRDWIDMILAEKGMIRTVSIAGRTWGCLTEFGQRQLQRNRAAVASAVGDSNGTIGNVSDGRIQA